jgi:ParB family transcriptional regulator, chromosome partitioning protein
MQQAIKLKEIGQRYSQYRLMRPETMRLVQSSMERLGQLQPVIVCKEKGKNELIDGFKRYYAAGQLKWESLQCRVAEMDEITALAMILRYNQHGSGLMEYEEAKIVFGLKSEHGMKQEDISQVLSRSLSWVSRRLGFIEKLSESVQHHLRLGIINPSQARELVKLPRGKQEGLIKVITQHSLTSRQTAILVSEYYKAQSMDQQDYLLKNPLEVLSRAREEALIYDCRLGAHGNRLLKSLRLLSNQQHIFIGYSTHPPLKELPGTEIDILSEKFCDVVKKAKIIGSILKPYDQYEG